MLATYLKFILAASIKYVISIHPFADNKMRNNSFAGYNHQDTIRWTKDYKLDYSDFQGSPQINRDSGAAYDTFAISSCSIEYHIKIDSGKKKIVTKALFLKNQSWMIGRNASILKHEQGHFDITEIYARRLQKMVNEAKTSDIKEFLLLLSSSYKQIGEEYLKEQKKYDMWSMNTMGTQYYYKWIKEQLEIIP